jgi:hypothetical protein
MDPALPRLRRKGLIVRDLSDEVLVYDLERHRAHCLSPVTARVWRCCNGKRTAARLRRRTGLAVDADVVLVAAHRLSRARLLRPPVDAWLGAPSRSRRAWLRKAAALGGLSLFSVIAPAASQAATCIPDAQCATTPGPPCGNQPCCSNPALRCKNNPGQRGCICR